MDVSTIKMREEDDVYDILSIVEKRSDVLAQLSEEPLYPRDLVEELELSRSTITRALGTLEELDLVEKQNGKYVATRFGELSVRRFQNYRTEIKTLVSTKSLVQAFPEADPPPIELIEGADIVLRSEHGAFKPPEVVEKTMRENKRDTIAYFPTIINPNLPRVWYRNAVDIGNEMAIVLNEETYNRLKTEYDDELSTIAARSASSLYVGDGPAFGLICVDTDDGFTVLIVIYSEGGIEGTIVNQSIELHKWVKGLFDRIRGEARCVDDELQDQLPEEAENPTRADGA